ncbi:MAG: type I DNA topoisomerase [Bacteroidales bacterium]|nr:type I DNA topoisomerase [Bacteroidales bacterium]
MESNLVIVESPTKAKTIQKYLGDAFVVKSSFGHIRDLQDNSLSIDIAHGFKPEYIVPSDKKRVVSELKKLSEKASTIWLASDEDREGEAISWHLTETLGLDPQKTRRIVFHEITKDAIMHAVQNPRALDMDLVNAQQARRVLDRLVGFELSPILWRKIQRGLSAGRVQSVVLRLVVDREREINAFEPEPYYRVEALFNVDGVKVRGLLDKRFVSREDAREFLEGSIGAVYSVGAVDSKEGQKVPPPPFTTSVLQQEAARKLHLPVSTTMRLAQSLYERGLITYMRTDSTNLSTLAVNTAKGFIIDNFGPEYSRPRQYKTHSKGAQEAHEAIRPTFIANTDIEGTQQEKKLYQLIWKRTVASQMADARVLNTSVRVDIDRRSEKYTLQSLQVLFDGYLKLYREGSDDEEENSGQNVELPPFSIGQVLPVEVVDALCKYTQAPFRYSEQTLIKKMEELGIGRPSTYAPTITTLTKARGYLVKGDKEGRKVPVCDLALKGSAITESMRTELIGAEKGKLLPTDVGVLVTDYLAGNFPDIMDYDFTAKVEKDFDIIATGGKQWNEVISEFYTPFHNKVDSAISNKQYSHIEREIGIDPSDGQMIVARLGQFGPYVQKGDGEARQSASLNKGQIIENLTLEEAIGLFKLPRTVGEYEGESIVATKGRFGPYLKAGNLNVSIPKGKDPLKITLSECIALIEADKAKKEAVAEPLKEWPASDISIINGRYGPYLKHDGKNYRIPKDVSAESLTEDQCKAIIEGGTPTMRRTGRFNRSKKK